MNTDLTPQKIPVAIEEEMKTSFMDYAMSVIIARALPDVRDGLKPVHRRILYTQHQINNVWNRPYIKCARIVGDVLGKLHPHGDQSVYDALVRMAQDFNMRHPLVDGQGNFGSIDGDPAAAYRYTECRMTRLSSEMLADIEKETVDFQPNFDDKETEPVVLPTKVPNLLINGAAGIAVGMATNIPPHNLGEVVNAAIAVIANPKISVDELMQIVKGPDFPTAGAIHGRSGIRSAYTTGRGHILMRGRVEVEENEKTGRCALVATEIPFQVNKAKLVEKIAELVKDKRIEGISDLRDESDRDGMRIVIELKRDAVPNVVLNNLWKLTQLQETFGVIMLAIVDGRPQVMPLAEILRKFVDHRKEVVTRRTLFDLREARDREHILIGLQIALDHLDAIIDLIRKSKDRDHARTGLMANFELSERQSNAILDMRLAQLTNLERDKILAELADIRKLIAELEAILGSEQRLMAVIVKELEQIRDQYGNDRRTEIIADALGDISDEEMIAEEDMVVTVTRQGYVKRSPVSAYRAQKRGGRGVTGAQAADESDFVSKLFVASTHHHLLMVTDKGRAYVKKVYEFPQAGRAARGKAIVNLLELQPGEKVVEFLPVRDFGQQGSYVVMATRKGVIKKTELSAFGNVRATGIIALHIDDGDELVAVHVTQGRNHILLATKTGYAIRFDEAKVRPMGRTARGVRGISLRPDDEVVGMEVLDPSVSETLLTVCGRGYGKRTATTDYPIKGRGGLGVITIKTTERNGMVVGMRVVSDQEDLMVMTSGGKIIRMPVAGIPTLGRNTQGVRLIRLDDAEQVSMVDRLAEKEEEDESKELDPAVVAAQEERDTQPVEMEDFVKESAADEGEADDEADDDAGDAGDAGDPGDDDEGEGEVN